MLKSSKLINFSLVSKKMSSKTCNIAVCQFTATNNKENNLKIVKNLVKQASEGRAEIVFLPEACDYIGDNKEETKSMAEPLNGALMEQYKILARDCNLWLSIGGFHELSSTSDKLYNSHVLLNSSGDVEGVYRKLHLYDVSIPEKNVNLKESDLIERGRDVVPPIETPAGPLSLSICYDLRFPELSTVQRKLGATILTYPSAFTNATGQLHWEVLLRSRAIENQCYVIAAAQYGQHNQKRTSYGQSLIIDPWGKILAECPKYNENDPKNESIAFAVIDNDVIKQVRNEMPVFQHRRTDIYNLELLDKPKFSIRDEEVYKFADKTIPSSTVFYRTNLSFAFTNIRCVVPGHVLISSLRPAKRLEDLTEEEVADLFQMTVKVQKVMETVHSSSSSTICVQDGTNAGQTVPHVHVHILPRQPNDFDRNDDIYEELAKHDRDNNPEPIRPIVEMSQEAFMLRKYFV